MVSIVIDLLDGYLMNMSEKTYENIGNCLDTLNEFV